MRTIILLIFAIMIAGTCKAQEINEEYVDGRLVKYQTINGVSVATSLRSVSRNDGKYYMFDVSITNGSEKTITVKPGEFRALINTRKGLAHARVLTRKEYQKIKKNRESLRVGLLAFAGAVQAANAGHSTSQTRYSGSANGTSNTRGSANVNGSYGQRLGSVDYNSTTNATVNYSGSSTTRSYNGAAAYNAAQNEAAKLARFQDASAKARSQWNEAYIKNNTLSPLESMSGFVNVKFKRSNLCRIAIIIQGERFIFDWNPYDAEN